MKQKTKQKQAKPLKKNQSAGKTKKRSWVSNYYVILFIILVISFVVYLPVFNNNLLAWDDDHYIKNNPLVYSLDLKEIFSKYVMGNYHPFTILILGVEYQLFGLNAVGYHAINLVFHLLNVVLVFYAIRSLSGRVNVALVASLLFGIHPLHVESVAWAAELKDLLYTFFFLASYIFYLKYLDDHQKKNYFIALILFLASLLSKAMAASLPVLLILTDYFKGRKINGKTLLDKIPFLLLAIALGVVAVWAQQSEGATDVIHFSFLQRIIFASYGFVSYLFKLIIPVNLSAYYPYPIKSGEGIPGQYYLYFALLVGLFVAIFYSLRGTRKLVFGIGFYAITIFLVLQLLPVGGAIMADRYSYIPSIGIFYLAGEGFYYLHDKKLKWLSISLLALFAVLFSFQTFSRCRIWKDDFNLWNDAISKYENIPLAFNNRGHVYLIQGKNDLAINDFTRALELRPEYVKAYNNRGTAYLNINKADEALKDFDKAIELMPGLESSYVSRGNALKSKNRFDEALRDYKKAIELKPDFPEAYYSLGLLYVGQGKTNEAIENYSKAIGFNKNYIESYLNRGNVFRDIRRYDDALKDYETVIRLDPNFSIAYFNRGNLYMSRTMYDEALKNFDKAIAITPDYFKAYLNKGNVLTAEKKYDEAISSYSKAIEIKKDYLEAYYGRALAQYYAGRKDAACMDMRKASNLGYQLATTALPQICN